MQIDFNADELAAVVAGLDLLATSLSVRAQDLPAGSPWRPATLRSAQQAAAIRDRLRENVRRES